MQQFKPLNPQQQQEYTKRITAELERMTMSWDNELKEWYNVAINALQFASPLSLRVSTADYEKLFIPEKQGLNMKVVSVLVNNVEQRTPEQMGVLARDWVNTLKLNQRIGDAWNATIDPVQRRIHKECEIMGNKPNLVIAEA